jgi:radical SAM protein with 4Fe4S-binding SPASM domain
MTRRARIEPFGAIVQLLRPRALVFVDRARARRLGLRGSWKGPQPALGDHVLSAPLEAHLQLTNRCEVGCAGCYTGASPQGSPREWGLAEWKRAIDELARMGVFHLALGGGESAALPWVGEIAAHARARGLIPNLTTSGLYGLDTVLGAAHLFGQINVSLDGLGATYAKVRGVDGFARADAALAALRAVKREIGINVVVTRENVGELDAIFAHARARRLNEVELLRLKPSGRGAGAYARLACTQAQHRALLPAILAGAKQHKLRVRVDCSYVPMIAHHAPSRDLLAKLAVYGCTAGDFLVAAKATGAATACSFLPPDPLRPTIDELGAHWSRPDAFATNRGWRDADEPCRSCAYHDLCRGGCKVVSGHAGDARAPDPECPRVVDHRAAQARRVRHLPVVG